MKKNMYLATRGRAQSFQVGGGVTIPQALKYNEREQAARAGALENAQGRQGDVYSEFANNRTSFMQDHMRRFLSMPGNRRLTAASPEYQAELAKSRQMWNDNIKRPGIKNVEVDTLGVAGQDPKIVKVDATGMSPTPAMSNGGRIQTILAKSRL